MHLSILTMTERNKNNVALFNGAWWQSISNPHFFLKHKHVHDHTLTPISLTHLPNASGVTQNK